MDRELIVARIDTAMGLACQNEMRWGIDNCAFWVADILAPALGCDLMEKHRGRFRSKRGCYRYLGKGGLRAAVEGLAVERGWAWIPPERAQPGDIGLATLATGVAIMICKSPGWFVGRSEQGFAALPAKVPPKASLRIVQAWAVK